MKKNTNENNYKYLYLSIFIVVLLTIAGVMLFNQNQDKKKIFEVKVMNSANEETGCKTIYVDEDEDISEYSFDNGLSWKKSNYEVICYNGETSVIGRDEKENIIAEGKIEITDLKEEFPKISINFENEIDNFDDETLLKGVTAKSNDKNLTDRIIIESTTVKEDHVTVKYSVMDDNGNKTTVERKIEKKIQEKGTISFDQSSYTCKVGEKFDAVIEANSNDQTARVSSYNSNNANIATVVKHPTETLKCINCVAVQIECKTAGTTTLLATSNKGATTSVTVNVEQDEVIEEQGTIRYEQASYTCKAGEKIETIIKAEGNNPSLGISSYDSNNTNIAVVYQNPNYAIKTPSQKAVIIECKTVGTTTLSATSTTGATTSVTVKVENIDKGNISFDQTSYTCKVGEKIDAVIEANNNDQTARVSTYKSNNENIATVIKHPTMAVKCINCVAVQIECKTAGTTTLSATSNKGATTSVTVKVENVDKGTIRYEQTSYTCKVGEKIETIIKAEGNNPSLAIASYKSNNDKIATVYQNPNYAIKTPSQKAVVIECVSVGSTTLTATSTTGATTSVTVKVEKKETAETQGTIKFDQTSYKCNVGEKIDAVIEANAPINSDTIATVSSYKSNNTNVATIVKHPLMSLKCINCVAVQIECKGKGSTTLTAKSSTNALAAVVINVLESK